MIIVDVFVPGAAKTKGSMVARPNGSMRESVAGSSAWRALMAQAARDDIARRFRPPAYPAPFPMPYAGAVSVTVAAYLATIETQAHRAHGWLWPIWERAGDLDKLVRNVLDALGSKSKNPKMNGGAIVDDNLVCKLVAEKHVAGDNMLTNGPGVRIVVETL